MLGGISLGRNIDLHKEISLSWMEKSKTLIYIFLGILYINFHAIIAWETSPLETAFTALIELRVLKLLKLFTALAFSRFR